MQEQVVRALKGATEMVSAPHDVHAAALATAAVLYVPVAQSVQAVLPMLPSAAHFPAAQSVQPVTTVAGVVPSNLPVGHPWRG